MVAEGDESCNTLPSSCGTGRMQGMSHDSTFPDSAEAPDKRTDRALEALKIENEAGLGFRRRERAAMGNPYADPERYQVDREPTPGELWAGLLAGLGVALASSGTLIMNHGSADHCVAVVGVNDLVVVHTPDATLVTTRDNAEQVKALVARVGEVAGETFI